MTKSFGAGLMDKRRYHPLFADDLKDATKYFDRISAALGNRFRGVIRERLQLITENPELFGRVQNEIRASVVDRFPYVVLYEIQNVVHRIPQFLGMSVRPRHRRSLAGRRITIASTEVGLARFCKRTINFPGLVDAGRSSES